MRQCALCSFTCRTWVKFGQHVLECHAKECNICAHELNEAFVVCWCGKTLRRPSYGLTAQSRAFHFHLKAHGGMLAHLLEHGLGVRS